jgi:putative sigma-54 modulation protein
LELRITGRHAKLSPNIKSYAEEKLELVAKYDSRTRLVEAVLDHEPLMTTIEAKAHVGKGPPLVVKAKHETPQGAIDLVHDKLERAVRKQKERKRDDHRRPHEGAAATTPAPAAEGAAGTEEE